MKNNILTILLSFLISLAVFSQEEEFFSSGKEEKKERKIDKWAFGGNFWLSFGSSTYIELSPVALYKAHPRLMIGPGFTYIYQKDKHFGFETSTYGPRAIATYTLFANLKEKININIGNIVLHSEYEHLNYEKIILTSQGYVSDGRIWINTLLVGGGLYQPIGERGGISFILLYNLIDGEFSPYTNPVIRVGFFF